MTEKNFNTALQWMQVALLIVIIIYLVPIDNLKIWVFLGYGCVFLAICELFKQVKKLWLNIKEVFSKESVT